MARRRALRSEVLAGLDEAASEQLLPQAVDDDARDQRVVRINEPAREAQAVGRLWEKALATYGENSDFTEIAKIVETGAGVQMRSHKK